MDIVSVIREGKSYLLMAQLLLVGFQKKLGNQLQVKPGIEMMQALKVAEEISSQPVLADRDVKTTLKRTWASLGFFSAIKVLATMITAGLAENEITEEEIERLKSADALEEMMKDFSDALPGVRNALIDERDKYLAAKIRSAPGDSVVAVVGAGHVPGIKKWIGKSIDLDELEIIPPPSPLKRFLRWLIPGLILAMIVYGFVVSGADTSLKMFEAWFWINAVLAAIGAILALAHPLTVIAAFFASPFTSLNPLIGVGWVAGLVEALLRKPRVADFETIADDASTLKGIWSNRLSRILLVIALTNLFGMVGTFLGGVKVASLLGG
jgi:pheromone shutdown-related protein TraB